MPGRQPASVETGHARQLARSTGAAIAWRRLALAGILGLALLVRMREPLSSPIIGAEDPYLHMAHTWDLLQGNGFAPGYPPGFAILLVPFAVLGPDLFYLAARFLPRSWASSRCSGSISWRVRTCARPPPSSRRSPLP